MHHFDLKNGALHAEGAPLDLIADEVGTPVYVYSTATLKRHYGLLRAAADAHRDALGEALIAFARATGLRSYRLLSCGVKTSARSGGGFRPQKRSRPATPSRSPRSLMVQGSAWRLSLSRCLNLKATMRPSSQCCHLAAQL